MRHKQLGLIALAAALTVLPTLTITPASAQNWFQRTFLGRNYNPYRHNNNTYNPYLYNTSTYGRVNPYSYGSGANMNQLVTTGQISHAQHQAWVDSINARVARGELTLSEGNMILIRGFE